MSPRSARGNGSLLGTRHWRYLGHVQLITGPYLAAATEDPHEFLAFLSGKLDLQFIDGPQTLTRRVNMLDTRPDFDGRFRDALGLPEPVGFR